MRLAEMRQLSIGDLTGWRQKLAVARQDTGYWTANTRNLIEQMRSARASQLRGQMKNYAYWIGYSADNLQWVDFGLFSQFIESFARLAANLGEPGDAGVAAALDQAIELIATQGGSVTRLYLSKADYYRTLSNEDSQRREAILAAIAHATTGSAEWADAMLSYGGYLVDISHYKQAITVTAELRTELAPDLLERKYECGAKIIDVYARFASFRSLAGTERAVRHVLDYESRIGEDVDLARWVSMAYYYMARLAEIKGCHVTALKFYLKAIEIRESFLEDARVMGFFHARIAGLLGEAGISSMARDHLNIASDLFRISANQGSGLFQVYLGFAALDAADGNYEAASVAAQQALAIARSLGMWRGELQSLGYLLILHLRKGQLRCAFSISGAVIRTMKGGELKRNGIIRLMGIAPILLAMIIKRISRHRSAFARSAEKVVACPCGMHLPC